MGPNPGVEVHVSPQGFSEQATEKQSTAREQFHSKWKHHPVALGVRPARGNSLG